MSVTILETDAVVGNACRRNCVELDTLCAEVCPTHEPLTGLAVTFRCYRYRVFRNHAFPLGANFRPDRASARRPDSASAATRRENWRQRFARQHAHHRT